MSELEEASWESSELLAVEQPSEVEAASEEALQDNSWVALTRTQQEPKEGPEAPSWQCSP